MTTSFQTRTAEASRYVRVVHGLLPGVGLSAGLAGAAVVLAGLDWPQRHGLSALTLAIALGMLVGNTVFARVAPAAGRGVAFSRQTLLRLGVILYGLRLTVQDIGQVGAAGVLIDVLVLASTFGLACWIGIRWLRLDRNTAILIGVGSSICGAAAVMAAEPVVKARAAQVTVAVATVVFFGTFGMLLYPLLFRLGLAAWVIPGGPAGFGIYAGSTIHEVAQVVAASRSIGSDAVSAAVIAKMVRVMMLAPFLLALSAVLGRTGGVRAKGAVPWFAFAFVAVVVLHSAVPLPPWLVSWCTALDAALLATAMAALGLSTQVSAIRNAGAKPLMLGGLLFAWLVVGGALINHLVNPGSGFRAAA